MAPAPTTATFIPMFIEATGRFEPAEWGFCRYFPALPLGYVAAMPAGYLRDAGAGSGNQEPTRSTLGRSQATIGDIILRGRFAEYHDYRMKPLKNPWFLPEARNPRERRSRVTWVYLLPPWLLFRQYPCHLPSAFSRLAGLVLEPLRFCVERRGDALNDVAEDLIIATVGGTILAVILSFLLVTVWQEYDGAAATVVQEESAVADLFRISAHFPEPTSATLRDLLRRYVDEVVDQEWPAMRFGRSSSTAQKAVLDTVSLLSGYQPHTTADATLQDHALTIVMTIADARRSRLFANQQGIPAFFWVGNVLLATITIGFCFLFRVRSLGAHVVMTGALATVIATIFVLIALFDYPFPRR